MTPALMFPLQPHHPDAVAPFAELVARGLAGRLWLGQSLTVEPHQILAYLAGRGIKVPAGLGVTLMPLRHPLEAAVQARSVALATGKPVVVAYGAATPALVASLRGAPYAKPATAAAGYASATRAILDGGVDGHSCEACVATVTLPVLKHPTVEVGLGVIRPGMARLAGAVADVAVAWMTPAAYVRDQLVPALYEGAGDRAVRPRVVVVVHAALARPGRDPRRLALTAARPHLRSAHYTDMWRRAGVPVDPADPKAGAAALVDSGTYVYGSAEEVVTRLREFRAAGVDEVVLNPCGVAMTEGPAAALADAESILTAAADE